MRQAVDLSNYTTNVPVPGSGAAGGFITDQNCQDLIANGFTHAIIGTQWPVVTAHQLEVCHRNGMTLDIYSWLSWARDLPSYIKDRLHYADEYPLEHHWLDAEEAAAGYKAGQIVDKIDSAVEAVTNCKPGIYTGEWWWPATGNTTHFSGIDWWHAGYTYPTLPDFSKFRPYGGVTKPALWQYGGSVQLFGMNLDLNIGEEPAPVEQPGHDDSLNYVEGRDGLIRVGPLLIMYNAGVPVMRWGGDMPGQVAKNFGGHWQFLRNDGSGQALWSAEVGD